MLLLFKNRGVPARESLDEEFLRERAILANCIGEHNNFARPLADKIDGSGEELESDCFPGSIE